MAVDRPVLSEIEITPAIRQVLRRKEGWPTRYQEIEIFVQVPATGDNVRAFTYVVTPENRLEFDLCVTPKYRQLILDGAKELRFSSSYQQQLDQILRPIRQRTAGQTHPIA